MGNIRVLPESVANKIAAGEVIERPASVVKELIENALDAGATAIDVTIQHGGKGLIRVADNGCGMDAEDARLAFQSHATSKIATAQDLEEIRSFGFRGEALPSIAAVSRTRLITRARGSSVGVEAVVEGGSLLGVQEHPCREGTIVEVRDLFFNTPARRKFLKADSTELGHIQELVERLSLSALAVRFTLKVGEAETLHLPADQTLLGRSAAILGEEIAGNLLEIESQEGGIRLWGLIGKPTLTRANRSGQNFFVNHRWVRAFPFSYALGGGYRGLLMEDRFPLAVLFLDLTGTPVDVNVHPTKQEVRLSNESQVTSFIGRAVRERLKQETNLAPVLESRLKGETSPAKSYLLKEEPAFAQIFSPSAPTVGTGATLQEPVALRDGLRITKVLGQIHGTFLIAETEEGFLVMDQHAAHERVMFEALLANFNSGQPQRQMLFLEEAIELSLRQVELFEKFLPTLTQIGFEIDLFGERTFVIRAYPAVLGDVSPSHLIKTFLEEAQEGKGRTTLEDHKETIAALCACKKESVKAGEVLTPAAIGALLQRLAQCENPLNCPHGRPVFFTQSIRDLERQFKRT